MTRLSWVNLLGLLAALAAGMALAWGRAQVASAPASSAGAPATPAMVVDASGTAVRALAYRRIASASSVADQVLLELVEPGRLVAISAQTRRAHPQPWRWGDVPSLQRSDDLEAILALKPDLMIVNAFADARLLARLRGAGLVVFDLGAMHGLDTLRDNVLQLGQVLGVPERARACWERFSRRLRAIAADIPLEKRQRGMYVGVLGTSSFGGGLGSSFHDVLLAAGLRDVAAEAGYEGWPSYSSEQLLALDPPLIVTQRGRERELCRRPGNQRLAACRDQRVIGIEENMLSDPGLLMLDAAEALREAVYGPAPAVGPGER